MFDASAKEGVLRLARVCRPVGDLERASSFYRDALGFTIVGEAIDLAGPRDDPRHGRGVTMRLGGQEIDLLAFDPPGRPYPGDSTAADLWFQHIAVVVTDLDAACRRVRDCGAAAITSAGPQRLPAAAGGVSAFKFRDPDGHPVELIRFPQGTGAPMWNESAGPSSPSHVTIGYDHTAISVADVERSIAFYTGPLGMRVKSRQTNEGIEQDHLDGLARVIVDVVALEPRVKKTPHLELLGYRSPRGRPAPVDARRSDLASDGTVFEVVNLPNIVERLEQAGVGIDDSHCVERTDGTRAAFLRDPDGHRLVLCERPA